MIKKYLLQLVYPPRCIVCETLLKYGTDEFICDDTCRETFKFIEGDVCIICGLPAYRADSICQNCNKRENIFNRNIATFVYEDMIQDMVFKLKYAKQSYMGAGLGELMFWHLEQNTNILEETDIIAPVPIHKKRLKMRGFNQAELLSNKIAQMAEIRHAKDLLLRIKHTRPLSNFSPAGRVNTLKNALVVNKKYDIKNASVLLIDDIFTTGATMNSCAKILLGAGATTINTATLTVVPKKKEANSVNVLG